LLYQPKRDHCPKLPVIPLVKIALFCYALYGSERVHFYNRTRRKETMSLDAFELGEKPVNHDEMTTRRREKHIKKRWLWTIGILGFLLPGLCPPFTFFFSKPEGMFFDMISASPWPYPYLFTPGMPVEYWFKALSIYTVLAIGTTVSAVLLWHSIAHKAAKINWKQGMKAGVLANIVSYLLTGIMLTWFSQLKAPTYPPGIEQLVSFIIAATTGWLLGLVGLLIYGWWTTPVALVLGWLCGYLEGRALSKIEKETLKYE
jgi:hypothetical protein